MGMTFTEPTVVINYKPYAKMMHYIRWAKGEISGFGEAEFRDNHVVVVKSVFILPQECSAAYTELTEEGLTDFLYHCAKKGKDPSSFRFWWHSHVNFSVFFSTIDTDNIARLASVAPWVSLCANKRGHMVARYDDGGKSTPMGIFVNPTSGSHLMRICRKQIKRMVGPVKS